MAVVRGREQWHLCGLREDISFFFLSGRCGLNHLYCVLFGFMLGSGRVFLSAGLSSLLDFERRNSICERL